MPTPTTLQYTASDNSSEEEEEEVGEGDDSEAVSDDSAMMDDICEYELQGDHDHQPKHGARPIEDIADMTLGEKLDYLVIMVLGMRNELSKKEKKIEKKITQKLERFIEKSDDKHKQMEQKMKSLEKTVSHCVSSAQGNIAANISSNFVIRNLPEGSNENIPNKVKGLLKDGLKVSVQIVSAERKKSYNKDPGIVIVKCKNAESKKAVMDAKSKLRDSRQFRDVQISHDKTKEQRTNEANLRAIAYVLGKDKVQAVGPRLIVQDQDRALRVNRQARTRPTGCENGRSRRSPSPYYRSQRTKPSYSGSRSNHRRRSPSPYNRRAQSPYRHSHRGTTSYHEPRDKHRYQRENSYSKRCTESENAEPAITTRPKEAKRPRRPYRSPSMCIHPASSPRRTGREGESRWQKTGGRQQNR
jgi:hypothetical protein